MLLDFLVAARGSAAETLTWALLHVAKNPEVERKVQEEILEVCGMWGMSYDDLDQLPYIDAVLKETMRLYPPVPVETRAALHNDILPDGTNVPAGAWVWCDLYSIGRDCAIWGEDSEVFRPERWLETNPSPDNEHPGRSEEFGRHLANMEMKTCFALLLPHFSFKLASAEDEEVTINRMLQIGMKGGLSFIAAAADRANFD